MCEADVLPSASAAGAASTCASKIDGSKRESSSLAFTSPLFTSVAPSEMISWQFVSTLIVPLLVSVTPGSTVTTE